MKKQYYIISPHIYIQITENKVTIFCLHMLLGSIFANSMQHLISRNRYSISGILSSLEFPTSWYNTTNKAGCKKVWHSFIMSASVNSHYRYKSATSLYFFIFTKGREKGGKKSNYSENINYLPFSLFTKYSYITWIFMKIYPCSTHFKNKSICIWINYF